jgi:hypothetical protein
MPPRTHHDCIVLYSDSGHDGSTNISTYYSLLSSPETYHSLQALINPSRHTCLQLPDMPTYRDLSRFRPNTRTLLVSTHAIPVGFAVVTFFFQWLR